MITGRKSLFLPEWPRYAVAAHIGFWAASALVLIAGLLLFIRPGSFEVVVVLFWIWVLAATLLGVSALCSGKIYIGNQVFSRKPTTGWLARLAGGLVVCCAAGIVFLGYVILLPFAR